MQAKPEVVKGGIPDEFIASKDENDLKTEIIPLPKKGMWLQIDYYDYPTGNVPKVWRKSNNRIAALEREARSKEKKGEPVSVSSIALQIEEMYLDSSIRFMVKKINGNKVDDDWFETKCNDSLRKILQTWRQSSLDGVEFPYPAWAREDKDEEPKNDNPPTLPIEDIHLSCGPEEEGVITHSTSP